MNKKLIYLIGILIILFVSGCDGNNEINPLNETLRLSYRIGYDDGITDAVKIKDGVSEYKVLCSRFKEGRQTKVFGEDEKRITEIEQFYNIDCDEWLE